MLQVVCPNQMAGGAGHMLCWIDETQVQCFPTSGPVHPCCVHHCRGGANAVPHAVQSLSADIDWLPAENAIGLICAIT